MQLTLNRILRPQATFGVLSTEDFPLCVSLELPWKGNQPGISCIPEGSYLCVAHDSTNHPNTWEVTGIAGRTEILIHVGNYLKDTQGCILVGQQFDGSMAAITGSQSAMAALRRKLPTQFNLTIRSENAGI